jgi:NADH dehydrogenase/NADH:ubiquinone oxidoreductase subunit G
MIGLAIDGKKIKVEPGRTLLEAAREHGIHIPTLCYHEALAPFGGCRMCVVELETPGGPRVVAACTYPAEEGAEVSTDSDNVLGLRQVAAQLLLARAGHVSAIRTLAESVGVTSTPFTLPTDACVLCARCVRACSEIVGVGAISMAHRGSERTVSPPFRISSADCIECATCVFVCPTGAITLSDITDRDRSVHEWASDYTRGACRLCEYHADQWHDSIAEELPVHGH